MVVLLTSSEVLAVPTCRGDAGGVTKVIVGGVTTTILSVFDVNGLDKPEAKHELFEVIST